MDVVMPDGTVVRGVPDGATKAQVDAMYARQKSGYPSTDPVVSQTGAPWLDRLATSFKMTPEGRMDYMRKKYGDENVTTQDGQMLYRDASGWNVFDEPGFSGRDIADLTPEIGITAATMAGPQSLLGIPLRAGAAAATSQAIGAAVPGSEQVSPGARIGNVIGESALALGGELAGRGLVKGIDALRPTNVIARPVNAWARRQQSTPFAQEGERLSRELGVNLSPGARTGDKSLTMLENLARQSIWSREQAFLADKQVADQFINTIGQRIDQLASRADLPAASSTMVGDKLRNTIKIMVNRLDRGRSAAGRELYGKVNELMGGNFKMPMPNLVGEIDTLISDLSGRIDKPAMAAIKELKAMRKRLVTTTQPEQRVTVGMALGGRKPPAPQEALVGRDINSAIALRSQYGDAARGKGNIFKDIEDRTLNRFVSGRLHKAVTRDFDAAPQGLTPEAAETFQQANKVWRDYTLQLQKVQASPLAKLVGDDVIDALYTGDAIPTKAVEAIAERTLKLKPSEVAIVRNDLVRTDPGAWDAVKAYVLENAFEKAQDIAPSLGARPIPFEASKFVNALPKDDAMRQIFSGAELRALDDVQNALRRWGDRTGYNFSGTGPANEVFQFLNTLKGMSGTAIASALGGVVSTRKVAEAMTTRQGREAIIELTKTQPGTRRFITALTKLTALTAGGEQLNP